MKKDTKTKGVKSDDDTKKNWKLNDKSEGVESVDSYKIYDANITSSSIQKNEITCQNPKEVNSTQIPNESQSSPSNKDARLIDIVIKK